MRTRVKNLERDGGLQEISQEIEGSKDWNTFMGPGAVEDGKRH